MSHRLPIAYALALGQVARQLCEIAARENKPANPLNVWYAHGHTSPARAVRIYSRRRRAGSKRDQVVFSSRMIP